MRRLACLLVLVTVGCKINVDQPTVNKPGDATTASTKPASTAAPISTPTTNSSTTTGSTSATTSGSPAGPSSTKPVSHSASSSDKPTTSPGKSTTATAEEKPLTTAELKKMPGYNPSRIYQLSTFKTADLGIDGHTLKTWIADTESKQQEGLMFVKDKDITDDQSMIFVYSNAGPQKFWMNHTYIPLDIAYIGPDKKVVSTATMKPFDLNNTPSGGSAQYALEMKVGSLSRLGIRKGTAIDIPPSVKSDVPAPQTSPQFGSSTTGG